MRTSSLLKTSRFSRWALASVLVAGLADVSGAVPPFLTGIAPQAVGQTESFPAKGRTKAKPAKEAGGVKKDGAKAESTGAGDAATTSNNPAPVKAGADKTADAGGGFVNGLVGFIKAYAVWILAGLGVALTAVVAWAYIGPRANGGAAEKAFADLGMAEKIPSKTPGTTRFSSTKIHAADVKDRLSRVTTTEVETDREYALVVDEEDLKMPPVPEDPAARKPADLTAVKRLLEEKDYNAAYEEYARHLASESSTALQADVELALGEELLRTRELEKAARVLEHHVSTRQKTEVRPETYFNLGYVHFLNRTYSKSRRYLHLFVELEKNPLYVARARKILDRMQSTPAKN